MPIDALFLTALRGELSVLEDSRLDKLHMPSRDEVILSMRTREGSRRLLICAGAAPRVHFTGTPRDNPQNPPMFCMLLRKHLSGARLVEISQPPMERVLRFKFDCRDELGRPCERRLIAELIPRRSNLILTDGEEMILGCLRRVETDAGGRAVLPGLFYRELPPLDRADPLTVSEAELDALLKSPPEGVKLEKWLLSLFSGVSPAVWRELAYRCGDMDILAENADSALVRSYIMSLRGALDAGCYLAGDTDFSIVELTGLGENVHYSYLSEMLELFYARRDVGERAGGAAKDLKKCVKRNIEHASVRLQNRERELSEVREREHLRLWGDIVTSNLHRMTPGMNKLEAENYFEPGCPQIEIALDPLLTPQKNAAKYYKEYRRRKTAEAHLTELIKADAQTLEYLGSVRDELERATDTAIFDDIRRELSEAGYIKQKIKKDKAARTRPLTFTSPTGFQIAVGRSNTQNDLLTFHVAGKNDLWFHVKQFHGSHVILFTDGRTPDDESIELAAALAVKNSQARDAGLTGVDFTLAKNVKKPAGAKAGMVIYTNYETIYVNPSKG